MPRLHFSKIPMYRKLLYVLRITSLGIVVMLLTSCSVHHVTGPTIESSSISVYESATMPGPRHGVYHSIAPGETLWRIAKMYEVDVDIIKEANNIRNVRDIDAGKRLFIPNAAPRKHVLSLYPSKKWKYIILHHSATDAGSSFQFDKAHTKRGWQGIGYHFVIDNGTCGKGDGQIETSPRWIKQQDGAHCKAGNMNEKGIGICLVGNYSKGRGVSPKQMDSLVYLVNKLRRYYDIPISNIRRHGKVSGAQTECPGKKFPWTKFRSRL